MSCLKPTGTVFIYISLFLAVITFLPGLPPKTEFEEISVVIHDWNSKVSSRSRLNGAEKLFEGELHGPEDLVTYNGQLYTGVHGGYVVRVEEDRIVPIVKFGQKCDGIWQEKKCGRPLGLNFDKKGNLYVVDTYYGIFKVNVATGEYKNIVNTSKPIEGLVPKIPNSIDIAENGDLYWTDSSTDFELTDLLPAYLSNPSGRLIRYNAAKKRNEVLMRKIGFANGIALNDDESYVIVSDMHKHRLLKYNLKGPKAGQTETFVEGLPGPIDNIHNDGHGGFIGVMYFVIDSEHPNLLVSILPHPYLRKMIVRLLTVIELPIKLLHNIYPNTYTERLMHAVGSAFLFEYIDTKHKSYVVRIDASGNVVDFLFSDEDTVTSGYSSACVHNGYLWLGSPFRQHLLRFPFPDVAGGEKQSSEKIKREATKSRESKQEKVSSPTTSKSTAAPTKSTAAPTTSNPSAVTPTPTAAPKPSPTPKIDKSSEATSKSANAEMKKDNAKSESSRTTKENNAKASTKSGKVEQDTSTKQKAQKSQSEQVKSETNRPKEEL